MIKIINRTDFVSSSEFSYCKILSIKPITNQIMIDTNTTTQRYIFRAYVFENSNIISLKFNVVRTSTDVYYVIDDEISKRIGTVYPIVTLNSTTNNIDIYIPSLGRPCSLAIELVHGEESALIPYPVIKPTISDTTTISNKIVPTINYPAVGFSQSIPLKSGATNVGSLILIDLRNGFACLKFQGNNTTNTAIECIADLPQEFKPLSNTGNYKVPITRDDGSTGVFTINGDSTISVFAKSVYLQGFIIYPIDR